VNLGEQAVVGKFDDPAAILGDLGIDTAGWICFSCASVPASSLPMSRLYPITSTARRAVSRHSIVAALKG